MFLNEDFIKIYEELSELNEAKADTQRLVDFAGEELANRFLALRSKIKAPENDLYYWIKKKTPEELATFLDTIEQTKSATQAKKDIADQGAKLVCSSEHWNVYHITTFEASQKYGRDSKWCITGVNNWGDRYWKQYKEKNIEFYFLITKGEYDPRGKESKIALAIYPNNMCEVFNQQDTLIPLGKVPYIDEINIPGIPLSGLINQIPCFECGEPLELDQIWYGPHGECYCKECFGYTYFICKGCGQTFYNNFSFEDADNNKFCTKCHDGYGTPKPGFCYGFETPKPANVRNGQTTSRTELLRRVVNYISELPREARNTTTINIMDSETGEVLYDTYGVSRDTTAEVKKALNIVFNHETFNYESV